MGERCGGGGAGPAPPLSLGSSGDEAGHGASPAARSLATWAQQRLFRIGNP